MYDNQTNSARPRPRPKPRIWTVLVIAFIELSAMIGVQAATAGVLLYWKVSAGQSVQEAASGLVDEFFRPSIFILMIVLSQLASGMVTFFFARFSAKRAEMTLTQRLGLSWPKLSLAELGTIVIGCVPVFLLSLGAVVVVTWIIPADESVVAFYKQLDSRWGLLFIVSIGVFPGFFEELFFRGFMQRRMLERFGPATAIGITSVIFGLFHVTPHGIALAIILGVWLGILAWRTQSTWPGVLCHAFINSGWNVFQVGKYVWGFPDFPPIWFCVIGGVIVVVAFLMAVRVLRQCIPSKTNFGTPGITAEMA